MQFSLPMIVTDSMADASSTLATSTRRYRQVQRWILDRPLCMTRGHLRPRTTIGSQLAPPGGGDPVSTACDEVMGGNRQATTGYASEILDSQSGSERRLHINSANHKRQRLQRPSAHGCLTVVKSGDPG